MNATKLGGYLWPKGSTFAMTGISIVDMDLTNGFRFFRHFSRGYSAGNDSLSLTRLLTEIGLYF